MLTHSVRRTVLRAGPHSPACAQQRRSRGVVARAVAAPPTPKSVCIISVDIWRLDVTVLSCSTAVCGLHDVSLRSHGTTDSACALVAL